MFSDFDDNGQEGEGRGRRTVSLLLAGGVFVALAASLGAAIATAHQIARREPEIDVAFATLEPPMDEPEPEPEPPPEPPPRAPRRAALAASDAPPTVIPDARPEESEGALVDPGEVGPVDGAPDGVEGGTGEVRVPPRPPPAPAPPPPAPPRRPTPPPQQERVTVSEPRMLSGCETPERPQTLEGRTAETIRVRVRVVVAADGRVLRATVVEGHALIPEAGLLRCVNTRVYEPATLEGRPVPYVLSYVFTFRPDVL